MEDVLVPIFVVGLLFIGLPWLIFHYMTKWKQASSLTVEDENLLDEMHEMALKLEERMRTIERLVEADRAEREEALPAPGRPTPAITDASVERLELRTRQERI
ncbi:MAG: envelope stress response membrane protein PspB [Thermaurantiacus sp.]